MVVLSRWRKALVLVSCLGIVASAALRPVDLRCESLRDPRGLDGAQPRLSWRFAPEARIVRGEGQTACQIRVAASAASLAKGADLLWDTGRMESKESNLVPYRGKPLRPFGVCFWHVRVWNRSGEPSPWSKTATWSMGPATVDDWGGARWIGLPEAVYEASKASMPVGLKNTSWIWTDEGKPRVDAPGGVRFFRRTFTLGDELPHAALCFTADNEVQIYVNGQRVLESKDWKVAVIRDVSKHLRPGNNVLAARVVNHDGPNSPAGLVGRLLLRNKAGKIQTIDTDTAWQWSATGGKGWQRSESPAGDWHKAVVMGRYGCAPWHRVGTQGEGPTQTVPSPLLRREFTSEGGIARATVTVCGLGYYELRINGRQVGDQALAPRFTRYDRRVLYQTFDVTDRIADGPNALGLMLGNGFYNQHARAAWDMDRAPWRAMPCAILLLRLEKADGTMETVVTDETWQAIPGPYLFDGIRNGVVYDPRRLPAGWDRPRFAGTDWLKAGLRPAPKGKLQADRGLPIRITREFKPAKVEKRSGNRWCFDGGRNIAGWARLRVRGKPGGKAVLRYRELLRADGSLDPRNYQHTYSGEFQTDTFLLTGGEQVLEPRFVYHGFRYVEVTGDIEPPKLADMTVRVVGTDFEKTGEFMCSNSLLNRIQEATLRSYRSNFVGMPTDCPHREKNGWTGDAQLAVETGLFNYASGPAYAVWMEDMGDCQKSNGDFPGIVPTGSWGYGIGPAWDAAFFVIPQELRTYIGDTRALTERYERMKLYLSFLAKRCPDHIVRFGLGDWCPPQGGSQGHKCPRDLTGTAYYVEFARLAGQTAGLLGKEDERLKCEALARTVTDAFNRTFLDREKGTYAGDTQTSLACALYQGLVPAGEKARVFARLVGDIEAHKRHLDCGILGTKYLLNVLTDNGRSDLAYAIATQTDFPSWGHWLAQGATSLWENWNGASSHNHVMFGDISAWCYKALAGIRPDPAHPGFRQFVLRPDPVKELTEVTAWHQCPYGRIESRWQRAGKAFTWYVVVPPGTIAKTYVPAAANTVLEGGQPAAIGERVQGRKPIADGNGIRVRGWHDGRLELELASGEYCLQSVLP
jgi:alpha-L-rhamnosidase